MSVPMEWKLTYRKGTSASSPLIPSVSLARHTNIINRVGFLQIAAGASAQIEYVR